ITYSNAGDRRTFPGSAPGLRPQCRARRGLEAFSRLAAGEDSRPILLLAVPRGGKVENAVREVCVVRLDVQVRRPRIGRRRLHVSSREPGPGLESRLLGAVQPHQAAATQPVVAIKGSPLAESRVE